MIYIAALSASGYIYLGRDALISIALVLEIIIALERLEYGFCLGE
jgi:hypothetical protein